MSWLCPALLASAAALRLPVFPVGRPVLPLDTLNYGFRPADFDAVETDEPRYVGLEHPSGGGVGALCLVAGSAKKDGRRMRAPVVAVGRYRRTAQGPARPGSRCLVEPWLDRERAGDGAR
eukprot:CAMPEP_0119261658 /NCGR_PEP_ID=MMETSP1329-20130426/1648_1 /TAXON_ID=114041 /ORGANISM="Genus nov. species nov., Strain RCC1024" /LENGTH=119 /DNA_ID=CAMNT_0007261235 /DNA_START=75 /DNA_END=431 /DNA_ORIENTATION=+